MAEVFTGKIMIPGDKIEEYFDALAKAEKEREPFQNYLLNLNEEFGDHLLVRFSERTKRKHMHVVDMFIHFLCRQTDVENINDITVGIANSHFRRWYKKKLWDSNTENDLKVSMKKFFQFLSDEKCIINEKVLKSFGVQIKSPVRKSKTR